MRSYHFLILLIFLAACSAEKPTSRKLEVSFGAISASQPTMLYGQRLDGSEKFARKLESGTTSIILPNGKWRFQAIYWENASKYTEGDPKCGVQELALTDSTSVISLTPSKVGCTESAWMGPYQWMQSADIMFMGFELNICAAGSTSLPLHTDCGDFDHGVTGMKIIFPEYTGATKSSAKSLETACYPINTGNSFYFPAKIPFGINADFPMYSVAKLFYAAPGCAGVNCCSGIEQDYNFPNGFGNDLDGGNATSVSSGNNRKVKLEQHANKHLSLIMNPTINYSSATCEPVNLEFRNTDNTLLATPINVTLNLTCTNCDLFVDSGCGTAANFSQSFPTGTSTVALYMKPTGANPKMTAAISSNDEWISAALEATTIVTYADADENYLYSVPVITDLSVLSIDPASLSVGNFFIYETLQGNRGKMEIVTVSGPSTFSFNFVTYGPTADISGLNKTITACSNGPCYLDFELASPVTTNNVGNSDFWYEDVLSVYTFYTGGGPALMLKIY